MISQRWKTKIIILQWTTLRYWVVANSEHNHTMFLFSWRLWRQKLFFKPNKHTSLTCIATYWACVSIQFSLFWCHVLTKWHFNAFTLMSCIELWGLTPPTNSHFIPLLMSLAGRDCMLPSAEVEKSKCKCVCDQRQIKCHTACGDSAIINALETLKDDSWYQTDRNKYSWTPSAPENNTYNKKINQKCQGNFLALKVAFQNVGPVWFFQKAAAKELIQTHSLPHPVTWPLTVQTASLSTVQDCAATFVCWAGGQLKKKAPEM